MPSNSRGFNRGPAAAADNRRALLAAARRLFAERGYHVPLSAIAKEAGVGQGVLYRHFPNRLALAVAVFEENFADLEAIAGQSDPQAFFRLWERLVDLTIEDTAFLEMIIDARRNDPYPDGSDRLRSLIEPTLERARRHGLVDRRLTADDVMLAQRMAYGLVVTATDPTGIRDTIDDALAVVGQRWPVVQRSGAQG